MAASRHATSNDVQQKPARIADELATSETIIKGPSGSVDAPEHVHVNYRHVAAVHSRSRTSCLSSDSDQTPSFLGFRNLMVIVLSKPTPSGFILGHGRRGDH